MPNGCITETGRGHLHQRRHGRAMPDRRLRAARALRPRASRPTAPCVVAGGSFGAQQRRPDPAAALHARRRDRAQPRRHRRADDDRLLQRDAPLARFRAAHDRRVRDGARPRQRALHRADHAGRQARVLRRRAVRHAGRGSGLALFRVVAGSAAGPRPRRAASTPPRRGQGGHRERGLQARAARPGDPGDDDPRTRPTTRPRRPARTTPRAAGRRPSRRGRRRRR